MNYSGVAKRLGVLLGFLAVIAIAWHNLSPVLESGKLRGQVGQIESYCFVYGAGCMELQSQADLGRCCTPLYATTNECNQEYASYLEQPSLAANCCQLSCGGIQSCIDQCTCDLTGECGGLGFGESAFSLTFDIPSMPVAMSGGRDDELSINVSGDVPVMLRNFEEALSLALQQEESSVVVSGSGAIDYSLSGVGELIQAINGDPSLLTVFGSGSSSVTLSFEDGVGVMYSTNPIQLQLTGGHQYLPASAVAIVSVGGIDPALLPSAFPLALEGSGTLLITLESKESNTLWTTVSGSLALLVHEAMVQTASSSEDAMMMEYSSSEETVMEDSSSSTEVAMIASSSEAVSSVQQVSSTPPLPVSSAPVQLPVVPLQPVQPVTRPPVSRIPLQQTGPAVVLVIAVGAAAGSGWVRRKK